MEIRHGRGMKATMPQLKEGQFAVTRDTKEVFAGIAGENVKVLVEKDIGDIQNQFALNITHYGAKAEPGIDNSQAIADAIAAVPKGGTLVIPSGEYEYASELTIDKNNITIVFYGQLKFTGTGNAFTFTGTGQTVYNLHVSREYALEGMAEAQLIGTGVRLYNVKELRLYSPVISGFRNGLLFDTSFNSAVGYINIHSPKFEQNLISYNVPVSEGVGWANEVSVFGGAMRLGGFSNYTNSKYINIETGNYHRFFGTTLESEDIERKVFCSGSGNAWYACRFEGTNGVLDVEVTGNRNHFEGGHHLSWQQKISDTGQLNEFNFPQQNWKSIADREIYIDPVNGDDSKLGHSLCSAIKTCQRAVDLLPSVIDHNFTIYVKEGTVTDGFNIVNIRGKGSLTIIGNTTTPSLCSVRYVAIRNVHLSSPVTIEGIDANGYSATNSIYASFYAEDANVKLNYCQSVTDTNTGAKAGSGANMTVSTCTFSNKNEALSVSDTGGVLTNFNNAGSENGVAVHCFAGTVHMRNSVKPTATTEYKAEAGGFIILKPQVLGLEA